ncbi:fimbrillin family protein, partial [uncultured Parabacteroides sp.]|uniref:fimbrillin family protein n=1 Tax=uncultured Parabacteroides sp. TaxID=512312 RepID=UPI0025E746F6
NETANGAVIRFGGKITNIVSKAITEGNDFSDNATIGIFGWGHTIGNTTNQTLRKDLNNSQYTKTAGNSEFSSETHAHYSINPDTLLDFYAYYPYTITASPLNIPFDLKKQDDIMWATPVKNRDKTSADEPVNFSFNHILSAITLKFKKADDIKEEMILQSISMENYPSTIQLNLQTGELSAATSTQPYTLINDQNKEITLNEETIVTNYLLYPVEKPVFIVRMSNKDYRIESTKAFEGGKKQTYSFTIQAKNITISGSINPWLDGSNSEETVYF